MESGSAAKSMGGHSPQTLVLQAVRTDPPLQDRRGLRLFRHHRQGCAVWPRSRRLKRLTRELATPPDCVLPAMTIFEEGILSSSGSPSTNI